ncbi:redoxin domain-containing protein [Pedobacter sp. AW31-3R]|uniref:redoxin domain-containing protein n=1 Tax=Pedobacter sp. AW31-3R TaxID=3445781 RepID=UPI003FA016DA
MKKIITLSLCCLYLTGAVAQDKTFQVQGKLNGSLENGRLVYSYYIKDADIVMDSTKVMNGTYTLKGNVDKQVMLNIGTRPYGGDVKIFIAPAARLTVTHNKSMSDVMAAGSAANLEYNKVRTSLRSYYLKMDEVDRKHAAAIKAKDEAAQEALIAEGDSIFARMMSDVYPNYIYKNPNSPIVLAMLDEYMGGSADDRKLEPLFNALSNQVKNSPEGKRWAKILATSKLTSIGKPAPDFIQNDTTGNPVKLSSLRGKYVLVDFWASWCGPCRAENPNVLKAYQKLKDKGFEVIGVSIDGDRKAWMKAIKEDGMPWTQVSDLKADKNGAAILYGVDAIPQNWLLDPNGVVLERNLRGEDLAEQIERLMTAK